MKIKHNKKRNTAFVYEALIREGTSAILQNDDERKHTVVSLIKKHFTSDSLLKKDLDCYRSLYETTDISLTDSSKILREAKIQKRFIDAESLFKQQSDLIHDVNKDLGPEIFNNFVPNYKSLASIYQMFSNTTSPKDAVLLENAVLGHMQQTTDTVVAADVDDTVINTFVDKFNKKYDQQLFEEQKTVLNLYISSFVDNSVEFKMYLNEEIKRLKKQIQEARDGDLISGDPEMLEKADLIVNKLDSFKKSEINEQLLSTILKVQSLVRETTQDGNSN